nr:variable large family protein [Borrelia persica]
MSKIIKKSLSIIMIIGIMGCGQQEQAPGKQNGAGSGISGAMMDLGRSAENAFYAFLELVSDVLGFTVTKETTRNKVGEYFSGLGKKLGDASDELEEVAKKATSGVDKGDNAKNPIRIAVNMAKEVLGVLKGHLDSLKDIGDANRVVEVANNQNGASVAETELKKAYNALKGIVDIARTQQVKEPSASSVTLAQASIGVDAKDGAKVLASGANAGAAVGDKAALIVSAVSGKEMLESIVKSTEGDATGTIGANVDGSTSALKFAKGGATAGHLAQEAAKAAAVAGGIALRSLVKEGKLASHNDNSEKAVQSAGISAVNKLLVAVEDVIKKTVKNVLEKAKEKIDEARNPKSVV